MNAQVLISAAGAFVRESPLNRVEEGEALSPEVAGLRMYDEPVFAFGAADDPWFLRLREEGAVGAHFKLPEEWLPGAKTVISFFAPASREVRVQNAREMSWPAAAWLHARIEGQRMISALCAHLHDLLTAEGYACAVPLTDARFRSASHPEEAAAAGIPRFSSNWSERHVAFVCGLGTFGLSKGLITGKGVAGRFGSLVTDLEIPPTPRAYTAYDEYCSRCGACARNCPAGAIDREKGKDHVLCSRFVDRVKEHHRLWYGCGKCQVKVPCEGKIPARRTL